MLASAMIVPLLVAVASWRWGRPALSSDTATGLLAWNSWRAGGPWNCIAEPSSSNLDNDTFSWVSWWSPGQYVWLGPFLSLGLSLGCAILASAIIAAWVKSIGFYILLRTLGCGAPAAALATLVEAAGWNLYFSFGTYNGSEVLQAALLPWLLIGFAIMRNRAAWWIPGIALFAFAAGFVKHAMFMSALAATGWLWWESNRARNAPWRRWLASGLLAGAGLVVARLAVARWVVNGGPSPGTLGQTALGSLAAIGYPFLGPLLSATGAGSVVGRLFFTLHLPSDEGWQRIGWLLALCIPLWLWFYVRLHALAPVRPVARMTAMFLAVYIAVMLAMLLGGASVSIEDRHFRPAGMLLIAVAAVICTESTTLPRRGRMVLVGILVMVMAFGLAATAQRIVVLARMDRVSPSGITQSNLSRAAAGEIRRIDIVNGHLGQVFFFSDSCMSLEANRSRVISTDAMNRPLDWFLRRTWDGRVRRLVLVLPASWEGDPRTRALEACFRGYTPGEWRPRIVGDCLFISAAD